MSRSSRFGGKGMAGSQGRMGRFGSGKPKDIELTLAVLVHSTGKKFFVSDLDPLTSVGLVKTMVCQKARLPTVD